MNERQESLAKRVLQTQRKRAAQERVDLIAGRDLVKLTLASPNPNEFLRSSRIRDAVLDRACYFRDENAMIERVTNDLALTRKDLVSDAANPENGYFPALTDAWKLIFCDVRLLEGAALQEAYNAQLQEEKLQTPLERAKEIARKEDERVARRNAKWFIPALEHLSLKGPTQVDGPHHETITTTIWKQVSPAPPAWIQQISDSKQPWGYVFYKTSEVERKYGQGWAAVWQTLCRKTQTVPYCDPTERSAKYACLEKIHCRGSRLLLWDLWAEDWPDGPTAGDSVADHAVREHFRSHRESLVSPGFLRNTFIVIDDESIPESLEDPPYIISDFWVWAYDADWEPSASGTLTEAEYQGRVKVSIYSLDAWFYAARYEGVSLRDMWLKAQSHPGKQWICLSKPLEEWEHESFV